MTDPVPAPPVAPAKLPLKERLKALLNEYGPIALFIYFAIFALTIIGFAIAIKAGARPEGTAATAGLWGAAWVATKLTQPLRILATLALTPIVGALWHRLRGRKPKPRATT